MTTREQARTEQGHRTGSIRLPCSQLCPFPLFLLGSNQPGRIPHPIGAISPASQWEQPWGPQIQKGWAGGKELGTTDTPKHSPGFGEGFKNASGIHLAKAKVVTG